MQNTPLAYTSEKYGIPRNLGLHPVHLGITTRRCVSKATACVDRQPRGGGIRKLRFALPGTGKSGGTRIIYYWIRERRQIYMLMAYPKSKKDDLSDKETAILRDIVKEL